jgi:hypothetical protein
MLAVSPKEGARAVGLAPFVIKSLMSENPNTLGAISKAAAKVMGVSADDFKRLSQDLLKSKKHLLGAGNLAEQNGQSSLGTKRWISSSLEAGKAPFTLTERFNRIAGYTTSWLEWHKANPGKILKTTEDIQEVGLRADKLVGNMTKQGQAAWQQGIAGISTQFWGYQWRLFESAFFDQGKVFSKAERIRIGTAQLALYGTAGTVGFSFGEDFAETLNDMYMGAFGVPIPKEVLETTKQGFMDRWFFEGVLGVETSFNQRAGAGYAQSGLAELLMNEGTFLETLTGVSGQTISQSVGGITDFADIMYRSIATGLEPKDAIIFLNTGADIFMDNVSSMNNARKLYYAYTLKTAVNRHGEVTTDDLTAFEGFLQLIGIDPAKVKEPMNQEQHLRGLEENKRETVKRLQSAINTNILLSDTPDWSLLPRLLSIHTYGLNQADANEVMSAAIKGTVNNETKAKEVAKKWMLHQVKKGDFN